MAGLLARFDLRAIYYVDAALFLALAAWSARSTPPAPAGVADRAGLG
jgi:hypothetical protein